MDLLLLFKNFFFWKFVTSLFFLSLSLSLWFDGGSGGKEFAWIQETQLQSLGQEHLWRREWKPTPVFLPGEFHGQRSLAGYSPWGCKKSDMIEQLTLTCNLVVFCSGMLRFLSFSLLCNYCRFLLSGYYKAFIKCLIMTIYFKLITN